MSGSKKGSKGEGRPDSGLLQSRTEIDLKLFLILQKKFLEDPFIDDTSEDVQTSILTSNLRIYQNVLPWLLVKLEQWRKVLVPWLDMWCLGLGKENTVPLHVLVPAGDAQCVWRHQAAGGAVGAADGRPGQDPPAVDRLR